MSFTETVKNGVLVLLPDGTEMEVVMHTVLTEGAPFLTAVGKLAKPRPNWPKNYALNHDY